MNILFTSDKGYIVQYVKKRKYFLALPDQDVITALYGDKIGILDTMLYNLSDRMLTLYNSDPKHSRKDLKWIRENKEKTALMEKATKHFPSVLFLWKSKFVMKKFEREKGRKKRDT